MGQIGAFRLCAPQPSHQLNFFIQETWYEEFLDCMNEATQIVDERRNAAATDADAQEAIQNVRAKMHAKGFLR